MYDYFFEKIFRQTYFYTCVIFCQLAIGKTDKLEWGFMLPVVVYSRQWQKEKKQSTKILQYSIRLWMIVAAVSVQYK